MEIVVNILINWRRYNHNNKAVIDSDETEPYRHRRNIDPTLSVLRLYMFLEIVEVLDLLSAEVSQYIDKDEAYIVLSISNGVSGNVWAYLHSYSDPMTSIL